MNERIQELRGQVKLDIDQYRESLLKLSTVMLADDGANEVLNAYLAKFAELIVRECAVQCNHNDDMDRILEHFGVEQCTT